jgi:hypothetical protein
MPRETLAKAIVVCVGARVSVMGHLSRCTSTLGPAGFFVESVMSVQDCTWRCQPWIAPSGSIGCKRTFRHRPQQAHREVEESSCARKRGKLKLLSFCRRIGTATQYCRSGSWRLCLVGVASAIGPNRRLRVGQSMSALPGYFRRLLAPLLPGRHPLRCPDLTVLSILVCPRRS